MNEELEKFRVQWQGIEVTVHDDHLHYSVAWGYGNRAANRANKLIEAMGLNLIAESSSNTSGFFTVKQKDNENDKGIKG